MEAAILLILVFATFAFIMIRNARDEKKRKETYKRYLKEQYGAYPDKEYKEDALKLCAGMHHQYPSENSLDDITWNDLGMDKVYCKIDHTQSAAGEEYLYWLLRNPIDSKAVREHLNEDISFFDSNEDMRVEAQMCLHDLGRISKFSIYDYLDFLDTLGKRTNGKHFLGIVALLISLALIFVYPVIGAVALVIVSIYQIVTYLSDKSVVEPFIASFAYIMRMLEAATGIYPFLGQVSVKEELGKSIEKLKSFSSGYRFIFRLNASTGNPLEIFVEYIKMVTHLDLIQFNNTLNQVQLHKQEIFELSKTIGYVDAVISIAALRKSLPYYAIPEFVQGETGIEIEDGFHPLLLEPVANSVSQKRGMIITGSNASGKSTFLRMTALSALFAQTILTVPAKTYRAPEFRIYSSMSLSDNLVGGESYYMVEIKALKRILDAIERYTDEMPVLCFVDEVLRGTNTVERIAASSQILKFISSRNVICFAATHDIELTRLLEEYYDNFHFEETVEENDVKFSYRIMEGSAKTRNAIRLLQIIGFGEEIISQAENQALDFMNTGEWNVC